MPYNHSYIPNYDLQFSRNLWIVNVGFLSQTLEICFTFARDVRSWDFAFWCIAPRWRLHLYNSNVKLNFLSRSSKALLHSIRNPRICQAKLIVLLCNRWKHLYDLFRITCFIKQFINIAHIFLFILNFNHSV